jgi:WhiB family redox-sensing transcriptional regulator
VYVANTCSEDPRRKWRARAACNGCDLDLFFPIGVTGPATDQIAAAKAICDGCQVWIECLEFALATKQKFGIWGGRDEEERRRLLRARRAQQRTLRPESVKVSRVPDDFRFDIPDGPEGDSASLRQGTTDGRKSVPSSRMS